MQWRKAYRKRGIFKRKAGGAYSSFHLRGKSKGGAMSSGKALPSTVDVPGVIEQIMKVLSKSR